MRTTISKTAGAMAAAIILGSSAAHATSIIQNGDFATGDLTGWTLFTTANGTIGQSPNPQVSVFDVTGAGAQNAAEFNVGQVNFVLFGTPEGGGLFQTISTEAGTLSFSADVAAFEPGPRNNQLGIFSVLLDGNVLDTVNLGNIEQTGTLRGSLDFSHDVTLGSHTLAIQMARPFTSTFGVTPNQYVTNISATFAAVPEPATWALMLAGFGGVGGLLRRSRRLATA